MKDALCSQVKYCSHQLCKDTHFNTNVFIQYVHSFLPQYVLFSASFLNSKLDTYLSKDIASQRLIQAGAHVYEFKKVQALSMFLHHHLKVVPIFKHFQDLYGKDA